MDFHLITPVGEVHILSTDGSGKILTPLPNSPPALSDGRRIAQPATEASVVCRHDNEHDGGERGRRITPEVMPEGPGEEGEDDASSSQR